ncbi:MAG: TonB family protein [Bacteroidales bacterium]|nr:TonB family protein [Bacteroidales bacterium]
MSTLIIWFFKANVAFFALYLFYRLFLHRDTFFREKRAALLFGFLFAIFHPLIDLSSWIQHSKPAVVIVQRLSNTLPEIIVTAGQKEGLSTEDKLVALYCLIACILCIRILWQIGSVLLLALRNQKECLNGVMIIHLHKDAAPFSFMQWIFVNPEEHSAQDLEEILHHEKAHAKYLHTLDVLLAELMCMIFWINPFVWLLKHHLRENLEYLADMNVIHSGFDPKSYQYHLLRLSFQQTTARVGNSFNVSQLKNRIVMMNKKRTSLAGLSKYALSLPLFAIVFLSAYAWGAKQENESIKNISSATTMQVLNPSKTTLKNEKTLVGLKNPVIAATISHVKKETKEIKGSNQANQPGEAKKIVKTPLNKAEQIPQFPGGDIKLFAFIRENLRYPNSAVENKIEGRVTIRFVVSETGEITNVEVLRSLDPACDNEAMRVIKLMPKWTPGKENGEDVPVYFTLPILFKLGNGNPTDFIKAASERMPKDALVLVDGIEKPNSILKDGTLNRNIESVSLLQDSLAIKAYGDRGKNGVILITTKKQNK